MGWILIFFPRRRNNDSGPTASPDITQSHPFSLIIILSVIFSMFLLPTASFASGWTTNGDALYGDSNISGYSWAQTTFVLMCISTVFSILLFPAILALYTLIHKRHGFSTTMRKVSFGFLICIILQIILIFTALMTFTIGFQNSDLQQQSLGFCVYLSWVAFGLYTIGGIAWFIYIWKYFHDYDKDYNTGKCRNCN